MDIADLDGSGTIDLGEFKEFIGKIDEKFSGDTIKEVFESIDENGDGELSVEEFGRAIHDTLKNMQADEEDQE